MKEKSFTLVELLAVIFIIGILAGLLLPAIGRVRRDAQIKAQQAEIRAIEVALELFYSDFLQYPPDPSTVASLNKVEDSLNKKLWNPDESPSDNNRGGVGADDPDSLRLGDPLDPPPMDLASEVFYYYLCREWLKTSDTAEDGDPIPVEHRYRILLLINPTDRDLGTPGVQPELDYIDVPGGNGSPYLTPKSDRIGDSDGDGLLELLDIWGRPYRYWNNADGLTCLVEGAPPEKNPFDSAVIYAASGTCPQKYLDKGAEKETAADVWHLPHNEFTFDIYSLGPNRANNLGFNDINFGNARTDDDKNGPNGGTVDDEDDVNNY